jgi:uncharacterized protein (TIGR02246 family)
MRWHGPIEDRLAIRELIDAYADAVFRRDATAWGATWAADGVWEVAGERREGRAAIVELWQALMARYPFAAMYSTGGGVRIDGREANGTWYVLELLKQDDGADTMVCGRYDDAYVCEAGVWRFMRRSYTILHMPGARGSGRDRDMPRQV